MTNIKEPYGNILPPRKFTRRTLILGTAAGLADSQVRPTRTVSTTGYTRTDLNSTAPLTSGTNWEKHENYGSWKWDESCKSTFSDEKLPSVLVYGPEIFDGSFGKLAQMNMAGVDVAVFIPQKSGTAELEYQPDDSEIETILDSIQQTIKILVEAGALMPPTSKLVNIDGETIDCVPIIYNLSSEENKPFVWESGDYSAQPACKIDEGYPWVAHQEDIYPYSSRFVSIVPSLEDKARMGEDFTTFLKLVFSHETTHLFQLFPFFKDREDPRNSIRFGIESFATWFALTLFPEAIDLIPLWLSDFYELLAWKNFATLYFDPSFPPFLPGGHKDYSSFTFFEALARLIQKVNHGLSNANILLSVADIYFRLNEYNLAILRNGFDPQTYETEFIEYLNQILENVQGVPDIWNIQAEAVALVFDQQSWVQKYIDKTKLPLMLDASMDIVHENRVDIGYTDLGRERGAIITLGPEAAKKGLSVTPTTYPNPNGAGNSPIRPLYYVLTTSKDGFSEIYFPSYDDEKIPSSITLPEDPDRENIYISFFPSESFFREPPNGIDKLLTIKLLGEQ